MELAPLRRTDYDPPGPAAYCSVVATRFGVIAGLAVQLACTLSASTDLLTTRSRSMSAMPAAMDATVKEVLRKRVDCPVEQGFARWDGDRVKVRLHLLPTLRQWELDGVCDGAR